jgi:hypothetical protein
MYGGCNRADTHECDGGSTSVDEHVGNGCNGCNWSDQGWVVKYDRVNECLREVSTSETGMGATAVSMCMVGVGSSSIVGAGLSGVVELGLLGAWCVVSCWMGLRLRASLTSVAQLNCTGSCGTGSTTVWPVEDGVGSHTSIPSCSPVSNSFCVSVLFSILSSCSSALPAASSPLCLVVASSSS